MKIIIIGGGPAGLYCASAIKILNPSFKVSVYEAKNESVNAFGLGYTLQSGTKGLLAKLDAAFLDSLFPDEKPPLLTRAIVNTDHDSRFFDFADGHGVPRFQLMRYLRDKAVSLKVSIIEKKVSPAELVPLQKSCDLLIGADGVNSIVRQKYAKKFSAIEHTAKIRFSWFYNDSPKPQTDVRFYLRQTPNGVVQLSSYPISETQQVVIIEMADTCFQAGKFEQQSSDDTIQYLSTLFTSDEDEISLISTQLPWFSFKMNSTEKLFHKNIAIIGDAAFSFHYSAGVGLNSSFSAAYTLSKCLTLNQNVNKALSHFNKVTLMALRVSIDKSLNDIQWLESIDSHLKDTPQNELIDHYLQKNAYKAVAN